MLILTRRKDEAIVIRDRFGAEIRLLVVDVRGNKVRLGIEAPADVSVIREEISKRIVEVGIVPIGRKKSTAPRRTKRRRVAGE